MQIQPSDLQGKQRCGKLQAWASFVHRCAKLLLGIVLLLKRRDKAYSFEEYEIKKYRPILNEQPWKQFSSIENFITGDSNDRKNLVTINNEYYLVGNKDYYAFRLLALSSIIKSFSTECHDYVELGCGTGMISFNLSAGTKALTSYLGIDISPAAIESAIRTASHFGLEKLQYIQADISDPDEEFWSRLKGKCVLTHHFLEQTKHFNEVIIDSLVKCKPKVVIHMEPTTELLSPFSSTDILTRLHIIRKDYTSSLIKVLRKRESNGDIEILHAQKCPYSPTINYRATIIVWKPVTSSKSG